MQLIRLRSRLDLLMASIASVAFGLAALRNPSVSLVAIVLFLTTTMLAAAAFWARHAPTPGGRTWWLGFTLSGWPYFVLAGSRWRDRLPGRTLVHGLVDSLTAHYGPYPTLAEKRPWYTDAMHEANRMYAWSAFPLVDLYLTLVVALAGAMLTWALAGLAWGAIAYGAGLRKRKS
jgi:hypothetical protein